MWQTVHDAWWRLATQNDPQSFRDALTCRVLATASLPYRAAVSLRNAGYDRGWLKPVRLPCPVVSVGNLTVGGTGKTACVELVAKKLLARSVRVAVLSRGYGSARQDYWLESDRGRLLVNGQAQDASDGLADEPQLLAAHLEGVPIVVGARRDRTGHRACSELGAEALILDDGFQHRRLHRDCEIVLVHARMPLGGWPMLPRGPMREPLEALSRAHVVIITKADEALELLGALTERLRSFAKEADFLTAVHEPTRVLDAATGETSSARSLTGLRVGLVSSIGDPAGFEATLRRLPATVAWHLAFPDHHRYDANDWQAICSRSREGGLDAVVTTEKDWVRLQSQWRVASGEWRVALRVLGVEMRILSGESLLDDRLARLRAR